MQENVGLVEVFAIPDVAVSILGVGRPIWAPSYVWMPNL
jgi:hypothetical protein